VTPVLATPPAAVTTTVPVTAPTGTVAVILVALQFVMVATLPLENVTLPVPCDGPKFAPAMTMDEPTAPVLGVRLVMLGAGVTVNVKPLLATFETVTTTLPVVVPVATVAVILVAVQPVTVAVVPLNLMVLIPWGLPNPLPAIVTELPTAPVLGVRLVMLGVANAATETSKNSPRRFFIHSLAGSRFVSG